MTFSVNLLLLIFLKKLQSYSGSDTNFTLFLFTEIADLQSIFNFCGPPKTPIHTSEWSEDELHTLEPIY